MTQEQMIARRQMFIQVLKDGIISIDEYSNYKINLLMNNNEEDISQDKKLIFLNKKAVNNLNLIGMSCEELKADDPDGLKLGIPMLIDYEKYLSLNNNKNDNNQNGNQSVKDIKKDIINDYINYITCVLQGKEAPTIKMNKSSGENNKNNKNNKNVEKVMNKGMSEYMRNQHAVEEENDNHIKNAKQLNEEHEQLTKQRNEDIENFRNKKVILPKSDAFKINDGCNNSNDDMEVDDNDNNPPDIENSPPDIENYPLDIEN